MSNALVELHCHILPGIDDGAKDLDMSMSLIRKELQDLSLIHISEPTRH